MKRLAGETAIYGVSSIVGKFLNWMLVPMYTRVLATESDFGIVTNLYAWTALLMVILTYGMETGFFRSAPPLLRDEGEQEGDQAPDAGICDDVVQSGIHFRPVYGVCVQCADAGQ